MKKSFKRTVQHIQDKDIMRKLATAVQKILLLSPELRLSSNERRFLTRGALKCATCEGHSGIKRWKALMNWTSRVLLRSKRLPALDCKVPRCLRSITRKGLRSDMARLCVLSLCQVYRLIQMRPEVIVTTMTDGFTGNLPFLGERWNHLEKACDIFKKAYNIKPFENITLKWHSSWAAGPNRTPSLGAFLEDFQAIENSDLWSNLLLLESVLPVANRWDWEAITSWVRSELRREDRNDWSEDLGVSTPESTWEGLTSNMGLSSGDYDFITKFDPSKVATSRLAFLSDKGGKTRAVALGDIYSQTLLAPVHQRLFKYLKMVPMDGTFDQDRQRDRVQRVTATERCIYSLDMTAATDRLPALYEAATLILTGMLTFDQGLAWFLVVTNRSFVIRKGDKRRLVRYSVGQPMGLLSSWATLAWSHHLLVAWAAQCVWPERKKPFEAYAVLGDDVVIWDSAVAKSYKDLLSNLGVGISVAKSFEEVGLAEFAKSYYMLGRNFKPISSNLLLWRRLEGPTNTVANASELAKRVSTTTPAVNFAVWLDSITPLSSLKLATLLEVYGVSLWGVWEGKPDPLGELAIKIIRFNKHVKEVLGLGLGYLPGSAVLRNFVRSVDRDPPYDMTPRSPIAGIHQSNVNSLVVLTEYIDPELDRRPHLFALLEKRKASVKTSIPLHVVALKQAYFGDLASMNLSELGEILSELRMDFSKNWSGYKVQTMPNPYILLGDDWIAWDVAWWGSLELKSILDLQKKTQCRTSVEKRAEKERYRSDLIGKDWKIFFKWQEGSRLWVT